MREAPGIMFVGAFVPLILPQTKVSVFFPLSLFWFRSCKDERCLGWSVRVTVWQWHSCNYLRNVKKCVTKFFKVVLNLQITKKKQQKNKYDLRLCNCNSVLCSSLPVVVFPGLDWTSADLHYFKGFPHSKLHEYSDNSFHSFKMLSLKWYRPVYSCLCLFYFFFTFYTVRQQTQSYTTYLKPSEPTCIITLNSTVKAHLLSTFQVGSCFEDNQLMKTFLVSTTCMWGVADFPRSDLHGSLCSQISDLLILTATAHTDAPSYY